MHAEAEENPFPEDADDVESAPAPFNAEAAVESDEESSDDEEELLRELEKIKKERAEKEAAAVSRVVRESEHSFFLCVSIRRPCGGEREFFAGPRGRREAQSRAAGEDASCQPLVALKQRRRRRGVRAPQTQMGRRSGLQKPGEKPAQNEEAVSQVSCTQNSQNKSLCQQDGAASRCNSRAIRRRLTVVWRRFINDPVRSEFHKKFLSKYID